MEILSALLVAIPQPDVAGMVRARQHIDGLLKLPGSLGRLETLAVQLASLSGPQGQPALVEKVIVVMRADHGVWYEGVTPSPQVVTAIHVGNMMWGNTGVCVLAARAGARVQVVDVGTDANPLPDLINLKVVRGSGNIARTAAMSRQQVETVLLASTHLTRQFAADGVKVFDVGKLGMVNTTPVAAVVSVLTSNDLDAVVGCGANLPLVQRGHKVAVVCQAIILNRPNPEEGLGVPIKVGGYDPADMTGVIPGAASRGLPMVLDGFLPYVSALATCRMAPMAHPYLVPSHLLAEKGARTALDALDLRPYLDMDIHLGEDSGTALAMHLLEAVSVMYNQMGTLTQSNIVLSNTASLS